MPKQIKSSSPYTHARSSTPAKTPNKNSVAKKGGSKEKNTFFGKNEFQAKNSNTSKNLSHSKSSAIHSKNGDTKIAAKKAAPTLASKTPVGRSSAKTAAKRAVPVARISSNRTTSSAKAPARNHSSSNGSKRNDSHTVDSLYKLFLTELHDLYSVENQILEQLPTLATMASNQKLKEVLLHHLQETKMQVTRLKKIFQILNENYSNYRCLGMEGVLKDGRELLSKSIKGATKDACIIAAAQKVEHYEICGYGTARAHAQQLKFDEIAHLLTETLEEEVEADRILSKIAEGSFFTIGINKQALEKEEHLLLTK